MLQHIDITRTAYQKLDTWLESKFRKPILVRGARQVGKSFTVRTWGQKKAAAGQFLEINFEEQPSLKSIFTKDLVIPRILTELQLATGINLEKPGSILFMDEIQECHEALMALRYFAEKYPQLPVLAAGSLVDFVLSEIGFPVGRIDNLALTPLSFFEFLAAIGKQKQVAELATVSITTALPEALLQSLFLDLRLYFRVGGMPEAIAVYASTHDLSEVSRVHSRLIRNYRDDFAKYAKQNDWEALNIVFDRLPAMIGRNRINYSKFDAHMRGEKIRRALTLLSTAGLVHRVISSQANQPPLNAESDPRFFKLLLLDIGLMQAMLGFDWRKVRPDMPVNEIHDGAFAEQFVGQELICSGSSDSFYQPHYWYRGVKGSEAEVDYVIVHKGCVTPVEVKSGSRGTLKSLALYQEKFTPAQCLVLSMQNSVELERIRWVPLFLASRLL